MVNKIHQFIELFGNSQNVNKTNWFIGQIATGWNSSHWFLKNIIQILFDKKIKFFKFLPGKILPGRKRQIKYINLLNFWENLKM